MFFTPRRIRNFFSILLIFSVVGIGRDYYKKKDRVVLPITFDSKFNRAARAFESSPAEGCVKLQDAALVMYQTLPGYGEPLQSRLADVSAEANALATRCPDEDVTEAFTELHRQLIEAATVRGPKPWKYWALLIFMILLYGGIIMRFGRERD